MKSTKFSQRSVASNIYNSYLYRYNMSLGGPRIKLNSGAEIPVIGLGE